MANETNNKGYNKRKNNKRKPHQFRKDQPGDTTELRKEKYNDPKWYVANDQVLKDVASLSFNNALGAQSIIGVHQYDGTLSMLPYNYTAPGIMSILTAPAMGVSDGSNSALCVAAKNYYSWIRHQNSGHVNYDSPDLMLYFGAMDSIFSMIAHMTRAYGVARVFSQTNRYIGDALLDRMGFDPYELRANLANFRGYINMFIMKVSAFCVPSTMTLYKRHYWMYSGVYKDEQVTKSQMYLYVPAVLWKYNELEGAGKLDAVHAFSEFTSAGASGTLQFKSMSLSEVYALCNSLLAAIVNSEDINIMSGDVLKAYGRENLWTLAMVPEDYACFPAYSEEVLDQIHNTSFAGRKPVATLDLSTIPSPSLDRLGIIQDPTIGAGALYFVPQFYNASHLAYDAIVDMHSESPTPEEVIVATRNILCGKANQIGTGTNDVTTLVNCGSDICLFALIATLNPSGSVDAVSLFNERGAASSAASMKITQFNKYPVYYSVTNGVITGVNGEIDNYTVISHDDVDRMHQSAILSELGVPFLGTASK